MTGPRRATVAFLGWTAVGAGMVLGLLTILTIGILVLPATALLAGFLAWRRRSRPAWPGMLTGLGLVPLYVAYLNRGGPGTAARPSALSGSCMQEMSPWPWVAAGLCLAGAGTVLGLVLRRSRAAAHAPGPAA
jgi:hypothetical protein